MKNLILIVAALILSASLAYATNSTATCPQDGDSAGFTGNKKIDNDHPSDRSHDVCEYSHQHTYQDGNGFHTQTHTFWQSCGD
jgi:hypothetical protein